MWLLYVIDPFALTCDGVSNAVCYEGDWLMMNCKQDHPQWRMQRCQLQLEHPDSWLQLIAIINEDQI